MISMLELFKKKRIADRQEMDYGLLKELRRADKDTFKMTYSFSSKNMSVSVELAFHRHKNGGGWVSNDAEVAENAVIGKNSVVMPNAKVGADAVIKDFVVIGQGATIHYGAIVESRSYVGNGATVCQFIRVPMKCRIEENEVWQNCLT